MKISTLIVMGAGLLSAGELPQPAREHGKGFVLPPSTFRVGAFGPGCDFSSLQQAIDAAQDRDRILVATDAVFSVQATIDRTLTVVGGYDSCLAEEPGTAQTRLVGLGTGSVLTVIATASNINPQITLRNLSINGGSSMAGGGLYADGDLDLRLENVTIADSEASGEGGGLMLFDRVRLSVVDRLLLSGNSANTGGGLYCDGSSIVVEGNLSISSNTADQVGGADLRHCALTTLAGSQLHIGSNQSDLTSGLQAINGSTLDIAGDLVFRFNESSHRSAMVVSGPGTVANVSGPHTLFEGNVISSPLAQGLGWPAALQVSDQAVTEFTGGPAGCRLTLVDSTLNNACTGFIDNQSTPGVGAARATDGSLTLHRAFFGENESRVGFAQAIEAGAGGDVDLQANVFFEHAGDMPLIVADDSQVSAIASTFVNNDSVTALIRGTGAATTLALHALVTYGNVGDLLQVSDGASAAGTCLYVEEGNDAGGLAVAGTVTATDMRTPDVSARDFAPSPGSRFLDACSDTVHPQLDRDIVGMNRPIDLADVPDVLGPYDAGAFELNEEIIWINGFEGG
ncbi:MAG: hypothetical protein AAGA23_13875 [Pseudomonadota bacterium]